MIIFSLFFLSWMGHWRIISVMFAHTQTVLGKVCQGVRNLQLGRIGMIKKHSDIHVYNA